MTSIKLECVGCGTEQTAVCNCCAAYHPDSQKPARKRKMARLMQWRKVLPPHPACELFPLLSPDELTALAQDIKQNGLRQPVAVYKDKHGKWWLLDGRNRLDAMVQAGRQFDLKQNKPSWEEIHQWVMAAPLGDHVWPNPVEIISDPYDYVMSANIHRRHLTADQKRDLIEKLLKQQPEKSNRQVAKQAKADHKTVASVRREQEAAGEIPQLKKTVGKDGKSYARKLGTPSKKKKLPDPIIDEDRKDDPAKLSTKDAVNDFHRKAVTFATDFAQVFTAWYEANKSIVNEEFAECLVTAFQTVCDKFTSLAREVDSIKNEVNDVDVVHDAPLVN